MRAAILVLAFALCAACNKGGESEVAANGDSGLTAERITANDVTAIDAVTGEAANMAADVPLDDLNAVGPANADAPSSRASSPSSRVRPRPAPSAEPASNSSDSSSEPAANAQ